MPTGLTWWVWRSLWSSRACGRPGGAPRRLSPLCHQRELSGGKLRALQLLVFSEAVYRRSQKTQILGGGGSELFEPAAWIPEKGVCFPR